MSMDIRRASELTVAIREHKGEHDISAYLYEAVGMIKQQPNAGTACAAYWLASAIKDAYPDMSDFCKRKVAIIEDAYIKAMGRCLTKFAKACELADNQYNRWG